MPRRTSGSATKGQQRPSKHPRRRQEAQASEGGAPRHHTTRAQPGTPGTSPARGRRHHSPESSDKNGAPPPPAARRPPQQGATAAGRPAATRPLRQPAESEHQAPPPATRAAGSRAAPPGPRQCRPHTPTTRQPTAPPHARRQPIPGPGPRTGLFQDHASKAKFYVTRWSSGPRLMNALVLVCTSMHGKGMGDPRDLKIFKFYVCNLQQHQ